MIFCSISRESARRTPYAIQRYVRRSPSTFNSQDAVAFTPVVLFRSAAHFTAQITLFYVFASRTNMEEKYIKKSVVNHSSFILNEHHVSLLARGLKFCPTPSQPNTGDLKDDLDKLHRQMRWTAFFEDPEDGPTDLAGDTSFIQTQSTGTSEPFKHQKFKLKSRKRGPVGPANLEAFIAANEKDFLNRPLFHKNYRNNLSPQEITALRELKSNQNIIIRPADKGSAVVILNREDYLKEGYRQLSNPIFYKHLENDPTPLHEKEITDFIEDMFQNGEIDENTKSYLLNTHGRTSELYLLPKIHKKTFNETNMPGRPIISANECPTERISEFFDFFLNPTTFDLPAYVKDTTDFINKISQLNIIPANSLLVTLDVESLYTNIPHKFGIQSAKLTLNKYRADPNLKPTNLSLLKLLEFVLTKNNFQFNGNNFIQLSGTAMGTKSAVGYANNAFFEEDHIYTYPYNFSCTSDLLMTFSSSGHTAKRS